MQLDPQTRMIQVCDLSGLQAFARDKSIKPADRVRVDALSAPKVHGNVISGAGGALRSGGLWIGFSFTCEVAADRMRTTAFRYVIGKAIPPGQWEKYNLWR